MRARTLGIVLVIAVVAGYIICNRSRRPAPEMTPVTTNFLAMKPTTKPHLPAPSPAPLSASSEPEPEPANLVARLHKGLALPNLTLAQVQPYLEADRRSAGGLLAASWATGDRGLLQEAKEKYPKDPQVNLVAYFAGPFDDRQPASPERQALLETFKQSDPTNPLGNYLAARDYFKSSQTDKAVEELRAAAGKAGYQDYSADFLQNSAEAWQAAGYSEAEAKSVASAALRVGPLVEVKRLGEDLVALANAYRQAGDATSAQAVLRIGVALGDQLDQPSPEGLVRNLAGLRVESQVLGALAPTTPYDDSGRTVVDRLAEIAQRRQALLSLSEQGEKAQQTMANGDLISFYDREKTFGCESALRWLVSRQDLPKGQK